VQETFERIREQSPQQKHLAIIAEGMNFVDLQGSEALIDETRKRKALGGKVFLISVKQRLWDELDR
jgi:SulP family sulfate permease